jgi:hypothetical protein
MAGATAGSQRAARLAEAEADSKDAAVLAAFAADVAADRDSLLRLAEGLGTAPNRLKDGVASVAEKLGGLKLNGRVTDRSPLSTVIELEAMQMAVRGKRALWETLQVAAPSATGIDALIRRANDQLEILSSLHNERVAEVFSRPT